MYVIFCEILITNHQSSIDNKILQKSSSRVTGCGYENVCTYFIDFQGKPIGHQTSSVPKSPDRIQKLLLLPFIYLVEKTIYDRYLLEDIHYQEDSLW